MNKKIKLTLIILVFLAIAIAVGCNVTATKENSNKNGSVISLELNSELVQSVMSKLDLLNNSALYDDTYKYLYFNIEDNQKELENDEKLYLIFEDLYKKEMFSKENLDGGLELLKIGADTVKDEMHELFNEKDIRLYEIDYKPSSNCGIVDFLYTGDAYELKYRNCSRNSDVHKYKLEEARKDGDFIKLYIKSFYAYTDKKDFKANEKVFVVKNYNEDNSLGKVSFDDLANKTDDIFEKYDIRSYVFSFGLKDDEYYLVSIGKA